jgi:cytochrome c oxidase cbb3-type subunit III
MGPKAHCFCLGKALQGRLRRYGWVATLGVLMCAGIGVLAHRDHVETRLLLAWPDQLASEPQELRNAVSIAQPIYRTHCARCHGNDLAGDQELGTPRLNGSVRLYGANSIGDLENTILYGVRSGHPKSHNVTDMPAEGRSQQLSGAQINDVVDYLLALNQRRHDEAAADRGRKLFFDQGNCFDCHGGDARGNADYGAPSLFGPYIYGAERNTLYQSIYSGRQGLCPAWIDVLSAAQIRALAAYLYVESHS